MRYLLLITGFVISSSIYAQTPGEKKNQRLTDEAVKKTVLDASALSEKFDKHSASIKDVPEQFKDESVVILFNAANYFIERGLVINFVERVKTRVYLKDKAAVEKYSTYYTSGYGENNSSEVTIIKANGTSRTLQLKDGIKETNFASVPLHYKSSVMLNETYYKFALPDLEPGDIVDFTCISKNPMELLTGDAPFTRIYLASDFPVAKTFLTIEVPTNDSYIYIKSLNGAPEATQKTGPNEVVIFTLVDSLREKVTNDWNLPKEKYLPHVKFILTRYTGSDNASVLPIRSSTDKVKTEFSNEEWRRCASRINDFKKAADEAAEYVMNQIGIQNPATRSDVNDLMEMTWYYLRKKVVNNEKIMPTENISTNEYDVYLATIFMNMLHKRQESFDLIFSAGNKSAGIKNVICPKEISWGIRWNDKYFMYPTCYMQYGELTNSFSGVEALIANNFNLDSKTIEFKSSILTAAPYTQNTLNENLNISLNENFDKILCVRTTIATKGFSSVYISKYYNRDFNIDQLTYANMYIPLDSNLLYVYMNKTKAVELKRKNDAAQSEYFKSVRDRYSKLVKSDYPMLDEYKSWKFNGYGVSPISRDFSMEETFTLNDLVKSAGNGYMVTIGALFGNYDKVQDDFRKRNYSGTLDVATTKTTTIILGIPEGYKVSLLESANQSFSDNFISMQSSLKVEGNTVVLTVTRDIKKTDFTTAEFASMVKYYDAMYELTQVKIVLKK